MRWLAGVVVATAALLPGTPLGANLWSLASGRGFFVPPESSLFTFRVTQENDGSGEWWLRGRDRRYLYALHDTRPVYLRAELAAQRACAGFREADRVTWCGVHERPLPAD